MKLSDQVKELEVRADISATALRDVLREHNKLLASASDYRTHPDFEGLRKAVEGVSLALLIAQGFDFETARAIVKG